MFKRLRPLRSDPLKIIVVGLDHIGAVLVPQLGQLLNSNQEPYFVKQSMILLVDPLNACLLAERSQREFGLINTVPRQMDVTKESVTELISEGSVVFCCDQRNSTARIISEHCSSLRNVTAIRGCCGGDNGAICILIRQNGQNITLPFDHDFYKNSMMTSDDRLETQFMVTNIAVASLMLNVFHCLLLGRIGEYDVAYLNVTMQFVRPVKRNL